MREMGAVGSFLFVVVALALTAWCAPLAHAQSEPLCGGFQSGASVLLEARLDGKEIRWCSPPATSAAEAMAYTMRLYVDAASATPLPPQPLEGVLCTGTTSPWECRALLPQAVVDRLAIVGKHTLEVTTTFDGIESTASRVLNFETPAIACAYTPPGGVAGTRPVGYTVQGVNPEAGQAARFAQLRKDGWFVEWQWDPALRRLFVMAECRGLAQ